jgi:transglutaminase-like putative cysteine protease
LAGTTATAIDDEGCPIEQIIHDPIRRMKLSVVHRTIFHYGGPVTDSVNELHLEPRTFPFQKTLSSLIRVLPATRMSKFQDLFQNTTHHFEIQRPHQHLEIESRLRVHNLPLEIPDEARTATKEIYRTTAVRDRSWPYLNESARVIFRPEIWRQAIDITFGHDAYFDKATRIMNWIHSEFSYEPGSTDVTTHLDQCFAQKRGVCQDFTHVMLGLCRATGIPARYASGYLYNGPRDHLIGAQASHAWAEVFLPVIGWIGFDPTNNTLADARYVKVAVGRDYEDVAPIRGTYRGSAHCQMEVDVLVEAIP